VWVSFGCFFVLMLFAFNGSASRPPFCSFFLQDTFLVVSILVLLELEHEVFYMINGILMSDNMEL